MSKNKKVVPVNNSVNGNSNPEKENVMSKKPMTEEEKLKFNEITSNIEKVVDELDCLLISKEEYEELVAKATKASSSGKKEPRNTQQWKVILSQKERNMMTMPLQARCIAKAIDIVSKRTGKEWVSGDELFKEISNEDSDAFVITRQHRARILNYYGTNNDKHQLVGEVYETRRPN